MGPVDEHSIQHCMRLAVADVAAKKWKVKLSHQKTAVPLTTDRDKLTIVPKPALDQYPKGLSSTEFAHLTRCEHVFCRKEIEQVYRKCYDERRDSELDDSAPPAPDQKIRRMVSLIASGKLLCGIFKIRKKFTGYRRMLIDMMMFADSVTDRLYKNIGECTCNALEVGDMTTAASQMLETSRSLSFPSANAQLSIADMPPHSLQLAVAFHSLAVRFKVDCGTELVRFVRSSSASSIVFDTLKIVQTAEKSLRRAFQKRNEAICDTELQCMDIVNQVNKCIMDWSAEVCKKLHEDRIQMIADKMARQQTLRRQPALERIQAIAGTSRRGSMKSGRQHEVKTEPDTPIASRTRRTESKAPAPKERRSPRSATKRNINYKLRSYEDSDDSSPPPKKRRLTGCITSLTELRRKASKLIRDMDLMIGQLVTRKKAFDKFSIVTDEVLKKHKCADIRFYKEFEGFKRR